MAGLILAHPLIVGAVVGAATFMYVQSEKIAMFVSADGTWVSLLQSPLSVGVIVAAVVAITLNWYGGHPFSALLSSRESIGDSLLPPEAFYAD